MNGLLGGDVDRLLMLYRLNKLGAPKFRLPGMAEADGQELARGLLGAVTQGPNFYATVPSDELGRHDIPKTRGKIESALKNGMSPDELQMQIYLDNYMRAVDSMAMRRPVGR